MKYNVGYNKDIDAVVISYSGNIGSIVDVFGLRIALPENVNPSATLSTGKTPKEQMWKREELPRGLDKTTMRSEKFAPYIKEQYRRRKEGLYFMNNGKYEYITGAHWMLMQWCKAGADLNSGYYYFVKAQQKLFWFWEACWVDERCAGSIFEKIRRFGATDCSLAFMLTKFITHRESHFGMTSKTNLDASNNFIKLMKMFKSLPCHMMPINRGESTTAIELKAPPQRTSKNNTTIKNIKVVGSRFDFEATKESSYDGAALRGYIADEYSKWPSGNGCTVKHWMQVFKALTKGHRLYGKAIILSTFENVSGNDYLDSPELAECGDKYKFLYQNSDPSVRDKNERTMTGLYKVFISPYEYYEGFTDLYGYPVVETPEKPVMGVDGKMIYKGIREVLDNEIDGLGGNVELINEALRKTPRVEEDGWRVSSAKSALNLAKIQEHIAHNQREGIAPIVGTLEWKDGIVDGDVVFNPNKSGRFKFHKLPPDGIRNACVWRGKERHPANNHIFCGGVDTFRVNQTAHGGGSKGSIHVYTKFNGSGIEPELFYMEYIDRPSTKEEFWEDVIKTAVYFGCELLIESNVGEILKHMFMRGYTHYSMRDPSKPANKLTDEERRYGGMNNSSEDKKQAQATAMVTYIEKKIGRQEDGSFYDMPFNATLTDWMKFNIRNREKNDASISSGLALFAAQKHVYKMEKNENKEIENTVKAFYKIK